ncbi:unnamed protein product [Rotaria socialis]|uniref:p-glycoprotein n=1 Tax=Rotaria socialis TaxID=392032 RepID=A0A820DL19_9BILA|nr:unnamed protein product [Rotaria socialis]CAF4598280.1 unnamed protein product [Rotaria socialis]CAF4864464.1 unnamed protein product [Rotaria socialis]
MEFKAIQIILLSVHIVVQQAIDKIRSDQIRTCLIIAHRLSTVRNCDLIYVMNSKGNIVESGTHDDLLNARGSYYQLLTMNQDNI